MFDLLFTSLELASGPTKCLIWEDRAAGICGGLKPISSSQNVAGLIVFMPMSCLYGPQKLKYVFVVTFVVLQVNV